MAPTSKRGRGGRTSSRGTARPATRGASRGTSRGAGRSAAKSGARRGAAKSSQASRPPESYGGAVNRLGSSNYQSKLREADIARARKAFKSGTSVNDLARKFDVHPSTMSRALRGLTFGHVKQVRPVRTRADVA
jgi:hypothetical protein